MLAALGPCHVVFGEFWLEEGYWFGISQPWTQFLQSDWLRATHDPLSPKSIGFS
jgi:hypothetical protein